MCSAELARSHYVRKGIIGPFRGLNNMPHNKSTRLRSIAPIVPAATNRSSSSVFIREMASFSSISHSTWIVNQSATYPGSIRWISAIAASHCGLKLIQSGVGETALGLGSTSITARRDGSTYRSPIASPLRSALAISPTCWPDSLNTAPFSLRNMIARAPTTSAAPAPAPA